MSGRRRASDGRVHQQDTRRRRAEGHPADPSPTARRMTHVLPAPAARASEAPAPAWIAPEASERPPTSLPSRRALRAARSADTAASPILPSRRSLREAASAPAGVRTTAPRAAGGHRAGGRPTRLERLRGNAATAGIVLASAGLVMGAVAPAAQGTAPQITTDAPAIPAPRSSPAVTAPADAAVTFGLVAAGPAADGVAPSIVTARALSASLTPAAKERKAFSVPVDNPVVASTFGYRVNPLGGSGEELHTGQDYASACGAAVKAADAGTVVDSGWHAYGGGQRIVIDHGDGLSTTYNHLSVLDVAAGARVARGDLLGAVGSTGNSTGCHLHFEVMVDDEKVDPQPWL